MPYKIVRADITAMDTDAIVNAANEKLKMGGGVCGAIFKAAGERELKAECEKIGGCKTGEAVITKGYKLSAKYIIHTVGPIYFGRGYEDELLYSCYARSLKLAKDYGLKSIAFPLISSGAFSYPKRRAIDVATMAIRDFLEDNELDVYLVVYEKFAYEISKTLFKDVKQFIDERYIDDSEDSRSRCFDAEMMSDMMCEYAAPRVGIAPKSTQKPKKSLTDMLKRMDKGFSGYLLDLIDESGKTDAQVYKKANVDRKLFSKIRNNPSYKPSKVTAVAFAVALELDMDGARKLIERAGYAFTRSSKFDIIIEYFIERGIYDIFEINDVLFAFDQPLL